MPPATNISRPVGGRGRGYEICLQIHEIPTKKVHVHVDYNVHRVHGICGHAHNVQVITLQAHADLLVSILTPSTGDEVSQHLPAV